MKGVISRWSVVSEIIFCLALCAMLFALCVPVMAQQPSKVPRIGIIQGGSAATSRVNIDPFREGLRDLGYVEGKNIVLEFRYADGDLSRLSKLASELVQLKVDLIVAGGTQTTTAAKNATTTIPIIVAAAGDLVATGLVSSLARPGGNITGSTRMTKDLSGKRIELLKGTIPKVSKVAVLLSSATALFDPVELKEMETTARHVGVTLQAVDVGDPKEFQGAYVTMAKEHADAVVILQGSFTSFHRKQLVELAIKHRLPSLCEALLFTNAGCLMSYGPDVPHLYLRAAIYADKILKGARPAELPVEQPTKFEFIINLKTANQIGLTIPPNVLALADKVIR
jgi:putative tryptophan/tyrosine transport system substrate-binding protein